MNALSKMFRIIAFTGDARWCEPPVPALTKADLLIAGAYFYEKKNQYHLNDQTLKDQLKNHSPIPKLLDSCDLKGRICGNVENSVPPAK